MQPAQLPRAGTGGRAGPGPAPGGRAGAAVDQLAGSAAGAVLLTPAHQFPLGAALAPQRRTSAIGWARDTGGVVIEDDYDGEFRYDRQPVGAMQSLAPGQVVYAGSASKSLAPGLRLGWLALPAGLADEVAAARSLADRQGSAFDQLTLAEFISSGRYDRQVRRARLAYRRRRDRLVATLAPAGPAAARHRHRGRPARAAGTAARRGRGQPGGPCGPARPGRRGARPVLRARAPPRPRAGPRLRHATRARVHRRARPALRGIGRIILLFITRPTGEYLFLNASTWH